MSMRLVLIILFIGLIIYGAYSAMHQPPRPTVVTVKPPTQNITTVAPVASSTIGCNEVPYIKLFSTEICGGIVYSLEYSNNAYVLLVENVSVRGKFTLQNSECTIMPRFDGWVRLMCKSYIVVTQ